jgi:hypothetical protein
MDYDTEATFVFERVRNYMRSGRYDEAQRELDLISHHDHSQDKYLERRRLEGEIRMLTKGVSPKPIQYQ